MKHIPISLDDEDYKKLLAICRALKLKMVQAIRKLIQDFEVKKK